VRGIVNADDAEAAVHRELEKLISVPNSRTAQVKDLPTVKRF